MAQPDKTHISWNDIESLCVNLHKKMKKARISPDLIMGVSRGGLIPGRIISGIFQNKNLSTIRVKFYTKPGVTIARPQIIEDSAADVKGKSILIVDDVIETGKTLSLVKRHFYSKGAKKLYLAVLFNKKGKKIVEPDFYGKLADGKWIVYPWEKYEKD